MKPGPRNLLIVVAALLVISLAATYWRRQSQDDTAARWKATEEIYRGLPVHPGFQAGSGSNLAKDMLASFGKSYSAKATWNDVRHFYVERLTATGWKLTQESNHRSWWRNYDERQLTFRKGAYSVVIKCREGDSTASDRDYLIELYEKVLGVDVA